LQDVKTSPEAVAGRKAEGGRGGGKEEGRKEKEEGTEVGGRGGKEGRKGQRKRDRERESEKVRVRIGWSYVCLDMTETVKQFTSKTYDFRFDQIPICKGKSM
jgi:hypothetical protein